MTRKIFLILSLLVCFISVAYAQIGIRAGVNIARQTLESNHPDYNSTELTGFHIGAVY